MNNLKKIGLTALAGSLVATSVFAGEVTVSGSASMEVQHTNGGAANAGKAFSMGNQLDFAGSGELDNGLNVSIAFTLDQGDDAATSVAQSPFDSHSMTIASDMIGSFTFAGEGGSSAQSAVDDVITGDLWDNALGVTGPTNSSASDNMIMYTLPSLVDGLTVKTSYVPKGSSADGSTNTGEHDSSTGYALAYSGVEGLTLGFAAGDKATTKDNAADVTTMYATYAFGPVTVGYTTTEYDSESSTTTADQDFTAYNIAYTVSENISVSYNVNEISRPNITTDVDVEVSGIKASYTTGGMTISGKMISADNNDFSTATTSDQEMWELAASFAF